MRTGHALTALNLAAGAGMATLPGTSDITAVKYSRVSGCTPRVVPLGFGILLRDPRGQYWLTKALEWGDIGETIQGYDLRGPTPEPLKYAVKRIASLPDAKCLKPGLESYCFGVRGPGETDASQTGLCRLGTFSQDDRCN